LAVEQRKNGARFLLFEKIKRRGVKVPISRPWGALVAPAAIEAARGIELSPVARLMDFLAANDDAGQRNVYASNFGL